MIIPAILLVGAVALAERPATPAHHFYIAKAFRFATNSKDFNGLRKLFTDDVWDGKKRSIAARDLHELAKKADRVVFTRSNAVNKKRFVMGLEFFFPHPDPPRFVLVQGIPTRQTIVVHVGGERFPCHWQVTRLTDDFKAARKFLERPLDYIKPSPPPATGGKSKDAILPFVRCLNSSDHEHVRLHSREAAWKRESPESPRRFHEDMRKRGVTVVPFSVQDNGDRTSVRIWMWNGEERRYESNCFVLLVREKDEDGKTVWLVDAVTKTEDSERKFLKGSE